MHDPNLFILFLWLPGDLHPYPHDCWLLCDYKPLHCTTIMSHKVCGLLMALAWVGSYVHSSAQIFLGLNLPFWCPNVVDHYFLWLTAFVETCLYKLLCDQPTLGVQQWGCLCNEFCHADVLLCNHIAFFEKPKCWKEEKLALSTCIPTWWWSSFSLVLVYLYAHSLQTPSPWIRL